MDITNKKANHEPITTKRLDIEHKPLVLSLSREQCTYICNLPTSTLWKINSEIDLAQILNIRKFTKGFTNTFSAIPVEELIIERLRFDEDFLINIIDHAKDEGVLKLARMYLQESQQYKV